MKTGFEQQQRFRKYIGKRKELGFDLETLLYTRHTRFDGEPCDICGSTRLIMGEGRYISFDEGREDDLAVFVCGICLRELEFWGIKTDMR
ncbi:MAG TPA: hypothetical protein ENI23_15415 [bacterium]|nr:hypothetical protein [bacterium]